MFKQFIKTLPAIAFFALMISCSRHPYIPPGDIIDIESPMTVHKKEIAVSGAFGNADGVFDYGILSG